MYGISLHQIKRIVTYQAWLPRNDSDYGYKFGLLASDTEYEGEEQDE